MDRRIHLKIKIKSLAAEAKIIREEARKVTGMDRWSLNEHRTGIVRNEARHSLLAYAIIRKKPYEVVEEKCNEVPNFKKASEMALRFGATHDQVESWVEVAKVYLKGR